MCNNAMSFSRKSKTIDCRNVHLSLLFTAEYLILVLLNFPVINVKLVSLKQGKVWKDHIYFARSLLLETFELLFVCISINLSLIIERVNERL